MIAQLDPDPRPPVIELIDVHKDYRVGTEIVRALRGVSMQILENDYVAIMGASGSGKSTMMNILGCLDVPTRGEYRLGGENVSTMSQSKLARVRGRRIGFVFQSFELLPRTTALKNVELPLVYSRTPNRRQRAIEALERVSLTDRSHHHPNQLSGGQKQRVAIARALAQHPDIILADEPTGNLDSKTGAEIMAIFDRLHSEGQTIIVVTHEEDIAAHCRRVIRLMDGQIVLDAVQPSRTVHSAPASVVRPSVTDSATRQAAPPPTVSHQAGPHQAVSV